MASIRPISAALASTQPAQRAAPLLPAQTRHTARLSARDMPTHQNTHRKAPARLL